VERMNQVMAVKAAMKVDQVIPVQVGSSTLFERQNSSNLLVQLMAITAYFIGTYTLILIVSVVVPYDWM